jgi:hypothetical protein
MATDGDAGYEVGYGRPPRHTRFPKGRSGNPKGRPKGSKNSATLLMDALRERVVISENGRRKTITKQQAIVKQIVNKAASGDHRSIQLLLVNQIPLIEARLESSRAGTTDAAALPPLLAAEERKARALEIAKILQDIGYLDHVNDADSESTCTSSQSKD